MSMGKEKKCNNFSLTRAKKMTSIHNTWQIGVVQEMVCVCVRVCVCLEREGVGKRENLMISHSLPSSNVTIPWPGSTLGAAATAAVAASAAAAGVDMSIAAAAAAGAAWAVSMGSSLTCAPDDVAAAAAPATRGKQPSVHTQEWSR